jgi:DNA-binding response OmpR family regulator
MATGEAAEADAFLIKPFASTVLLKTLRNALGAEQPSAPSDSRRSFHELHHFLPGNSIRPS